MKRTDLTETRAVSTRVAADAVRAAAAAACRAHAASLCAKQRIDRRRMRGAYDAAVLNARRTLADSRGWVIARSAFDPLDMLPEAERRARRIELRCTAGALFECHAIDHAEYYRTAARPSRPAAILSHTYAPIGEVMAFAARRGLTLEVLDYPSWYSPGNTVAVILTGPAVAERAPRRSNIVLFPLRGDRPWAS